MSETRHIVIPSSESCTSSLSLSHVCNGGIVFFWGLLLRVTFFVTHVTFITLLKQSLSVRPEHTALKPKTRCKSEYPSSTPFPTGMTYRTDVQLFMAPSTTVTSETTNGPNPEDVAPLPMIVDSAMTLKPTGPHISAGQELGGPDTYVFRIQVSPREWLGKEAGV